LLFDVDVEQLADQCVAKQHDGKQNLSSVPSAPNESGAIQFVCFSNEINWQVHYY